MIRLNSEEKRLLERAASKEGMQTATWARLNLKRAANQNNKNCIDDEQRKLLSIFCGPGGLDEGFRQADLYTDVAIDIDQECVNTFAKNHPGCKAEVHDISLLTLDKLDQLSGKALKPFGVLGGPPCQSFSVSNVHQKEDDPRHILPEKYAKLLKALNKRSPISFFVFENVPGLLGKKHKKKYEKFKKMFQTAGFKIEEAILNAIDYGVPQDRPRVFIVGINTKKHPGTKWIPPAPENKERKLTVRDTIEGLAEPIHNGPGLDPDSFPEHPNHWCLVPRSAKFSNGTLKAGKMFGRSFRRLAWDEPSWTVAYGHREVHVHPEGHRRLSIYEAMLLQSFEHSYVLTGNMSAQIRLISEAVPPRLAYHIAMSIKKCLKIK